jgi:hypothetical protein
MYPMLVAAGYMGIIGQTGFNETQPIRIIGAETIRKIRHA